MRAFRFDHHRLRHTAWLTLVSWLCALTAGVVNACVVAPVGPAERGLSQVSHAEVIAHGGHAGATKGAGEGVHHEHGESLIHHGHADDPGKVGCQKFCDDQSPTIAKVKLPFVDLGSSLLTVVVPWNAIAASSGVGIRPSLQRPATQGRPLVIRFLRLTL